MKKIIVFSIVIAAILFVLGPKFISQVVPPVVTRAPAPVVTVTFDTGAIIATESGVAAETAFGALTAAAAKKQWEVKAKQYDFGVFVQEIGTLANTREKSWIYFVNGKSGEVAADKQQVAAGDFIEWKYITPTIE